MTSRKAAIAGHAYENQVLGDNGKMKRSRHPTQQQNTGYFCEGSSSCQAVIILLWNVGLDRWPFCHEDLKESIDRRGNNSLSQCPGCSDGDKLRRTLIAETRKGFTPTYRWSRADESRIIPLVCTRQR